MGDVFKQNFPSARCQHCGGITDISLSHDLRHIIGKYKTLKELLAFERLNIQRIANLKNCQIEAMHKTIAQIIGILNEKQKKKARKINQQMREYIKKAKKEVKK